ANQPRLLNTEGLFTVSRSQQDVEQVAATPKPATTDTLFNGFADTRVLLLSPPSIFSDTSGVNVVFKTLLSRGTANPTGLFQWSRPAAPAAVALADQPLLPGDTLPYDLSRWAAGKAGASFLLARPAGGK